MKEYTREAILVSLRCFFPEEFVERLMWHIDESQGYIDSMEEGAIK